ncbi:DUF2306 domain-containing protein [Labrenzia suaedae]|uniref:DUF2306 domain-containing protein n=2 Tax=Roseibium litorale TaxID=2803841 RepID=A0ABR9CGW9_9HYPH|nr:DUF2306 domain-containing protein [Roseibium litorale]
MPVMAHHLPGNAWLLYSHIAVAPIVLGLLPFHLSTGLRKSRPGLHKWLGRFYGAGILVSGIASIDLALTTTAGPIALSGFLLLALLWLLATCLGIAAGIRRDIATHRRWMLRSAAMTFAAVTLRVYLPLSLAAGLPFELAYPAIAWLCWVPNLLVNEWYLRRGHARPRAQVLAA